MDRKEIEKVDLTGGITAVDIDGLFKHMLEKSNTGITIEDLKGDPEHMKEAIMGIIDNPNYAPEDFVHEGVMFFRTADMAIMDVWKNIDFAPYYSDILFTEDLDQGMLALYKENNLY